MPSNAPPSTKGKLPSRTVDSTPAPDKPPGSGCVGFGHPPKNSRWIKGQSGNPRRAFKTRRRVVELVDEFLTEPVTIVKDGALSRVSAFEAICFQLWGKATRANARALRVFLKYANFAAARRKVKGFELVFLPDDEIQRIIAAMEKRQ